MSAAPAPMPATPRASAARYRARASGTAREGVGVGSTIGDVQSARDALRGSAPSSERPVLGEAMGDSRGMFKWLRGLLERLPRRPRNRALERLPIADRLIWSARPGSFSLQGADLRRDSLARK